MSIRCEINCGLPYPAFPSTYSPTNLTAPMHMLSSMVPTPALRRWSGVLASLLVLTLVITGCDNDGDGGVDVQPDPNIAELASSESDLSTLVSALQQAGLVDDLEGDGPFTVFAPVNSAFQNIDADELTGNSDLLEAVLTYHVVAGQEITAGDIQDGQTVETLEGGELTFSVSNGAVSVNGANVTTADLQASNGVVHLVDGVLLETVDAVDRAVLAPNLSTLATAVDAAGLAAADSPLRTSDPITIFAPVDDGFEGLDLDALTGDTDLLTRVLQYHVVPGSRITSDQIAGGETLTTLEGGTVDITVESGSVFVNGIPVTTVDIQTENAVIHLIDGVLLQNTNVVERATVTEAFSILVDLVGEAGLASALSGPGPDGEDGLTVFAPTNDAFLAALDANGNGTIDAGEIPSNAADILQYHVLDDVFFAADVPEMETDLPTLEGSNVTVVRSGSDVTVNPSDENASVVAADVDVSNGVIHGIDTVLIP